MSKTTDALEVAVAAIRNIQLACDGRQPTNRERASTDRLFAEVLRLIAPRIRHFIKQYGLVDHWEDAEQVCAIAVHRSIEAYDPEKARFTTFINWQLRGELQGLRFRLRADQRSSAKKVGAVTVSFDMLARHDEDDGGSFEAMIPDDEAEERTEALAALHLARNAAMGMIDDYIDHLRALSVRQLSARSKASSKAKQPKRRATDATSDAIADLPKYVRVKPGTLDPAELDRLEARLLRDRLIMERHLLGDEDALDDARLAQLSRLPGGDMTSEQMRQVTRRAGRAMIDRVMGSARFNPDYDAGESGLGGSGTRH